MENNIFTNILDVINYKNINEVKDGKIADVEYDPISFEMNLLVSFPKILPVKIMADFNKCIKEGLVKEGLAKVVNVKYKYDLEEIDEFSLKEYYKYTVDALKDKKIIYRSLDCFNTDFSKNEIKLWIGKGNDDIVVHDIDHLCIVRLIGVTGLHCDFIKSGINRQNAAFRLRVTAEEREPIHIDQMRQHHASSGLLALIQQAKIARAVTLVRKIYCVLYSRTQYVIRSIRNTDHYSPARPADRPSSPRCRE